MVVALGRGEFLAAGEGGGTPLTDDLFLKEADRIYSAAQDRGIIVRFLGGLAFRYHCPAFAHLSSLMDRKLTDIDFAAYSAQRGAVEALLRELNYATHSYVQLAAATLGRSVYWRRDLKDLHVDVFWDDLRMNHDVTFKGRLELDAPTIPLPELLLEKMQIVKLNWKDVKDVVMLLREHEVGNPIGDKEVLDASYVAHVLSDDWGFYFTFARNVDTIRERMAELTNVSAEDRGVVLDRLSRLMEIIQRAPKSMGWRMRARIGPRKQWYRDVDELA